MFQDTKDLPQRWWYLVKDKIHRNMSHCCLVDYLAIFSKINKNQTGLENLRLS